MLSSSSVVLYIVLCYNKNKGQIMDSFLLILLAILTVFFALVLNLELERRKDLEITERKQHKKSFKYYTQREQKIIRKQQDDKSGSNR